MFLVKRELKVKVRLSELDVSPMDAKEKVKQVAKYVGKEEIVDYFFISENLGEEYEFRLRKDKKSKNVTFKVSLSEDPVQENEEYEFKVDNWEDFVKFIELLGFRSLSSLRKKCEVYNKGEIDIRLSHVEKLGDYLEVTQHVQGNFSSEKGEKLLDFLVCMGINPEKVDNRYYGVIKEEFDRM